MLLALIQISLSSCLLWKGAILTLKQSSAYFLVFIVLASGLCTGMNFFYTQDQDVHSILNSQKKVKLFYSTLLVLNLVGVCLVLSETILTQTAFQQELVDLFLPSFFFLFGIDLLVFLPFEKYSRDLLLVSAMCIFFWKHLSINKNPLFYQSCYSKFVKKIYIKENFLV